MCSGMGLWHQGSQLCGGVLVQVAQWRRRNHTNRPVSSPSRSTPEILPRTKRLILHCMQPPLHGSILAARPYVTHMHDRWQQLPLHHEAIHASRYVSQCVQWLPALLNLNVCPADYSREHNCRLHACRKSRIRRFTSAGQSCSIQWLLSGSTSTLSLSTCLSVSRSSCKPE